MFHAVYDSFESGPGGRDYVGKHSSMDPYDSYLGSFRDASFVPDSKIVIAYAKTAEGAIWLEIQFQRVFGVVEDPQFVNRSYQTSTGFYYASVTPEHSQAVSKSNRNRVVSDETRQKQSESQKRISQDPEIRRKRSESAKKKPPVTEKTRERMRAAQERLRSDTGLQKRKGRPGRKQSDEHKQKRAEAQTGKPLSEERKRKIAESLKKFNEEGRKKGKTE